MTILLSEERIDEIIKEVAEKTAHKSNAMNTHRLAINQALQEAEPIIRKDEREKIADYLENEKVIPFDTVTARSGELVSHIAELIRNMK